MKVRYIRNGNGFGVAIVYHGEKSEKVTSYELLPLLVISG